jgi:hypothetical protein
LNPWNLNLNGKIEEKKREMGARRAWICNFGPLCLSLRVAHLPYALAPADGWAPPIYVTWHACMENWDTITRASGTAFVWRVRFPFTWDTDLWIHGSSTVFSVSHNVLNWTTDIIDLTGTCWDPPWPSWVKLPCSLYRPPEPLPGPSTISANLAIAELALRVTRAAAGKLHRSRQSGLDNWSERIRGAYQRCPVTGVGSCWSETMTIAQRSHLRLRSRRTAWAGITATEFTVSSTSRSSRYLAHYKLPSGSVFGCWGNRVYLRQSYRCRLRTEVGERLLVVRSRCAGKIRGRLPLRYINFGPLIFQRAGSIR